MNISDILLMNLIFGNQELAGEETTTTLCRSSTGENRISYKLNVKQDINILKEPIKKCT